MNANFNLAFHLPKKDRALKNADKADGSTNEKLVVATFDFQKVLQTPHGEVSTFYYKRKLNAFNFTVYDVNKKAAVCYMWHEVIAKKGANEVSSCL